VFVLDAKGVKRSPKLPVAIANPIALWATGSTTGSTTSKTNQTSQNIDHAQGEHRGKHNATETWFQRSNSIETMHSTEGNKMQDEMQDEMQEAQRNHHPSSSSSSAPYLSKE